jgi:transcriptional regulator with XRE-family HTH domain
MATLAAYVQNQMKQRGWSLRDAERETGVSRSALDNILKNEDVTPGLDTLTKLASVFGIPLWRIVEMCGFDLGIPREPSNQSQRLTTLINSMPQLQPIVDHLLALQPDDLGGILDYLELVELRRNRQQDQDKSHQSSR